MPSASEPAPARPMERSASGGDRRRRHHGQHVAAEPAQVRAHDRHGGAGGDGGVGGRAAPVEHAEARRRGQLVGRRHHAAQAGARPEGGEGEGHGLRNSTEPFRTQVRGRPEQTVAPVAQIRDGADV